MPLVQTSTVGSADFANATVTLTGVTPGNTLIIYGGVESFGTVVANVSTDRGDTVVTELALTNNGVGAVLARVNSAVGGTTTITLSGSDFHRLVVQEWSGLTYDTAAGVGEVEGATTTFTVSTPNSTASANSVSFSTWALRAGSAYNGAQAVATGYTESGQFTSNFRGQFVGGYRTETTTGVKSAQWVDPGIFPDLRAGVIFNFSDASSGGTTYTITPSGGISFAGTVVGIRERVFSVSGGVSFSGTAPISFANGSVTYTINPSGGVVFSGTVNIRTLKNFSVSGGITFSGTVFARRVKAILPTGGIVFSGDNVFRKREVFVPTGTITFSGTAPITYNGIPPASTTSTRLPMTSVGQ